MFTKIDHPIHFPGRTLLGDTRGPVIDTGIDHNGWIYINEIEGKAIGALWDMVEVEVHEQLAAELDQMAEDLAAAQERIVELEELQPKVVALSDVEKMLAAGTSTVAVTLKKKAAA